MSRTSLEQNHAAPTPGSGRAGPAAALGRREVIMPTLIVVSGALMSTIANSALNTALPALTTEFAVSPATIAWVTIGPGLTQAALVTVFGRLSDVHGRTALYACGIAVTVIGSILCGLSSTIELLLGSRVLQGVGGAMVVANSVAYLLEVYPRDRRGFVVGAWEACIATGLGIGPVVGGVLLGAFGWQSIFFASAAFGALLLALIPRFMRELPRARARQSFDFIGALSFAAALAPLMFALSKGHDIGWTSLPIIVCLAIGGLALLAFIGTERRVADPMVDLTLFRSRGFSAGNLAKVCAYFGFAGNAFLLPFYWDRVLHLAPATLGLVLTASPVGMLIGSAVFGPLSDRIGTRILAPAGLLLVAGAAAIQTQVVAEMGYQPVLAAALLGGLGIGAFIAPNDSAILSVTPRDKLGVANGIMSVSRTLGMLAGQSMVAGLLTARLVVHGGEFTPSYHEAFLLVVVVTLTGLALAAVRDPRPRAMDSPAAQVV